VQPDEFHEVDYAVAHGVATITLNRPERRNAWSGRMAAEYRWALHHCHTDPAVRVAVLTGAGEHFCGGASIERLNNITGGDGSYRTERIELPPFPDDAPAVFQRNHAYPLTISTPVIAALNGICAGAGFVLATYADIRFADADARLATAFSKLGLPAEFGMGWILPRIMGTANAAMLLYGNETVSADEAARLGWVQRVVPSGTVLEAALAYAGNLARSSSAESLRTMKKDVFIDANGPFDVAYERSVDDMNAALKHPDMKEGLRAQRDRRAPDFLATGEGASV
jgi:enoyl-CoA hydratase/carnithine racemase